MSWTLEQLADYAAAARALILLLLLYPINLVAHPGVEDRIYMLSEDIAASPNSQYLYVQRGLAYSNNAQPQLALADIKTAETLGDPLSVTPVSSPCLPAR